MRPHLLISKRIYPEAVEYLRERGEIEYHDSANVVLTPHIAGASTATRRKMCMMAAESALAALDGQRPPNLVNRALFADEA